MSARLVRADAIHDLLGLGWDEFPALVEALARWLGREVLPPDVFKELADVFKGTAFSAAKAWDDATRQRLFSLVEKALTDGMSFKEFSAAAGPVLDSPWYADLVWRTNIGSARSAGRYAEVFGGTLNDVFPYWTFRAVLDARNDEENECPNLICRKLDGQVFRKDDLDAQQLLPPLHWSCRCICGEKRVSYTGTISSGAEILATVQPPEGWRYNRVQSLVPDIFLKLMKDLGGGK